MKMTFGKRVVLFLHWLCSALLLAAVAFQLATKNLMLQIDQLIGAEHTDIALAALGAVYAILCIAAVIIILRNDGKRSERGFITVDSSETGRVRIAVSAIEQMVKQAVGAIDGIAEMKISISNSDDAISINVNTVIVSGVHMPTVTLNMQRAIRQFVEMNCGVAVSTVSVNVQAVAVPGEGRKGKGSKTPPASPVQEWQPPVVPEPAADSLPDPVPLVQNESVSDAAVVCDESVTAAAAEADAVPEEFAASVDEQRDEQ